MASFNLLETDLSTVGTAVLYLDWMAHRLVTPGFLWCVLAAALLAMLVYSSHTGAAEPYVAAVSGRCPQLRPILRWFSKAEMRRMRLEEGELLFKEAEAILHAPGQSGREAEALTRFMRAASCGMDYTQKSDLFLRSIHQASDLCRLMGKAEKALRLKQVEKFYCESVVVRHADPTFTAGLEQRQAEAMDAVKNNEENAKEGLAEQRCQTFTRLARMFLAQNDAVMAMDYALKAFALREKLEGAKLKKQNVPGLTGLKEALSDALATTEEQTILRECFMASAAPLK